MKVFHSGPFSNGCSFLFIYLLRFKKKLIIMQQFKQRVLFLFLFNSFCAQEWKWTFILHSKNCIFSLNKSVGSCQQYVHFFGIMPLFSCFVCFVIRHDRDWKESPDCIRLSESECDLTNYLEPLDRQEQVFYQSSPVCFYSNPVNSVTVNLTYVTFICNL